MILSDKSRFEDDEIRPMLTPPKLAKRWGVEVTKVLAWIRSGELRAINFATKIGRRPRFKVRPEDVEAFEEARTYRPQVPRIRRRPLMRPPKRYF